MENINVHVTTSVGEITRPSSLTQSFTHHVFTNTRLKQKLIIKLSSCQRQYFHKERHNCFQNHPNCSEGPRTESVHPQPIVGPQGLSRRLRRAEEEGEREGPSHRRSHRYFVPTFNLVVHEDYARTTNLSSVISASPESNSRMEL